MPDIIQLLESDHKEVKALLKQLTADEPPEDCDALFEKLYTSVKTHSQFEEENVYPLLRKGETKDMALEALEEHRQVTTLLDALNEMDDEDETCMAKMQVLSEDLNHHIKEEEGDLFPQLKKAVSIDTLERLGQSYQEVKNEQETEKQDEPDEAVKATKPAAKTNKGTRSH